MKSGTSWGLGSAQERKQEGPHVDSRWNKVSLGRTNGSRSRQTLSWGGDGWRRWRWVEGGSCWRLAEGPSDSIPVSSSGFGVEPIPAGCPGWCRSDETVESVRESSWKHVLNVMISAQEPDCQRKVRNEEEHLRHRAVCSDSASELFIIMTPRCFSSWIRVNQVMCLYGITWPGTFWRSPRSGETHLEPWGEKLKLLRAQEFAWGQKCKSYKTKDFSSYWADDSMWPREDERIERRFNQNQP